MTPPSQNRDTRYTPSPYSQGLHIWEVFWSQDCRGTHPVIGVATGDSPLTEQGYKVHQTPSPYTLKLWPPHLGGVLVSGPQRLAPLILPPHETGIPGTPPPSPSFSSGSCSGPRAVIGVATGDSPLTEQGYKVHPPPHLKAMA